MREQRKESPFWTCSALSVAWVTMLFITSRAHMFQLNLGAMATPPLSLYLYRMPKDSSEADRLVRVPPAHPARRITASLTVLSKRTPAHTMQLKYILLKAQVYTSPIQIFPMDPQSVENVTRNTKLDCENCYRFFHRKPCDSQVLSDMSILKIYLSHVIARV